MYRLLAGRHGPIFPENTVFEMSRVIYFVLCKYDYLERNLEENTQRY
jgi:hypothetical protein